MVPVIQTGGGSVVAYMEGCGDENISSILPRKYITRVNTPIILSRQYTSKRKILTIFLYREEFCSKYKAIACIIYRTEEFLRG